MTDSVNGATSPPDPNITIGGNVFALDPAAAVTKNGAPFLPNPGNRLLLTWTVALYVQGQSGTFYLVDQSTAKVQASGDPRLTQPLVLPLNFGQITAGLYARTITVGFANQAIAEMLGLDDLRDEMARRCFERLWQTGPNIVPADPTSLMSVAWSYADKWLAARGPTP